MDYPKIHIGCGPIHIPGWINFDIEHFKSVDAICDARVGIPVGGAQFIFAEHFIEHLSFEASLRFLRDCRLVLVTNGVLRLSTPNLDWVWATSYSSRWRPTTSSTAQIRPTDWRHDARSTVDCINLNLAFRGWGHKFLFNKSTLEYALLTAGFRNLEWCQYGHSTHNELSGLEKHPQDPEIAGTQDILIVEASGESEQSPDQAIEERISDYYQKTSPNRGVPADRDPRERGSRPLNSNR